MIKKKYHRVKPAWNKGKKLSVEHRRNLSISHLGVKKGPMAIEIRLKISNSKKGIRTSIATEFKKGHKNLLPLEKRGGGIFIRNPKERIRFLRARRRARKKAAGGYHTQQEWEKLKEQYKFTCPCCLRKEPDIKLTVDHIVPISRGGTDSIDNIQPLCHSCNCKKYNKTIKY